MTKCLITDEEFTTFVDANFSTGFGRFIKEQLKFMRTSAKGSRYSNDYKQFALTIYFLGPQVYKFLSKTFRLPSKSTLFRISRKWDMPPGLNDFIFSILKAKVQTLETRARDCTLCLDEMSLKTHLFYDRGRDEIVGLHQTDHNKTYEPATNVMVIMARGIHNNWKQPVAYFFVKNACSADDVKTIIFECIEKMTDIGFNVLATVTDQGSNFYKFAKNLCISEAKPYFFVNDKKIYFMFDIPHLLKSTRNNFFLHHFITDEGKTDKKYIVSFYEKDKVLKFRLAPKLTDIHINPNGFQKMKVKYAAQIFSATLAAGLNTYVALGALPLSASATVSFIEKMDKLFDLLNSSRIFNSKEYNRPFIGSECQITFLNETKSYFKSIKCVDEKGKDRKNSFKFISGWLITISAFLNLWEDLRTTGTTLLYTRRFNQDCLENFFSKIRQQSGNNVNPTPIQFSRSFRKLFSLNYFNQSEGANCIEDFDSILTTLDDNQHIIQSFNPLMLLEKTIFTPLVDTTDYVNLHIPEKNSLTYICGYLIKKCLQRHTCDTCTNYANQVQTLSETTLYSHFRAYENKNKDVFGNLMMPPEWFISYIESLEEKFCDLFPIYAVQPKTGLSIKSELHTTLNHPCPQFPIDYLLSLFVRVRIFYSLKFLNRGLLTARTKKDRKLNILQHL